MFLAAAPYFQSRFADNQTILANFQAAITSVATVTNFVSMLMLTNMQATANYPFRILASLVLNMIVFSLLAISTVLFRAITSTSYLIFTLIMVFCTSVGTGLCQNGAFAFAASFSRPEYLQAIMTGQAIAGVLPSMAQIITVLGVPEPDSTAGASALATALAKENRTAAFIYFLTATGIGTSCFISILPLVRKYHLIAENQKLAAMTSYDDDERPARETVGMLTLYKKLHWHAAAIFVCFAVSMFMPVFTQKILSNVDQATAPRLLKPSAFIPLGFLVWNIGDLGGRLLTLGPLAGGAAIRHPPILLMLAFLRVGFIPLYLLCNIGGHGATIPNDAFYLFVVQFLFGATNGWLGSVCMMDFVTYVDDGEREAAGGFMAVNLIAGLMVGSLMSFAANGVS